MTADVIVATVPADILEPPVIPHFDAHIARRRPLACPHQVVVDELPEPPLRRFHFSNAFGHSLKSIERSRSSRCRKKAYACRKLLYRNPGQMFSLDNYRTSRHQYQPISLRSYTDN